MPINPNEDPSIAGSRKDAKQALTILNLSDSIHAALTGSVDIEKKGSVTKFYKLTGELSNLGWVMLDSELIEDHSMPEHDDDDDLDGHEDDGEGLEDFHPREENIVFLWRVDGIPANADNLQGQYAMVNMRIVNMDEFFIAHEGYITLDEKGNPLVDDSIVEAADVARLNSRVIIDEAMKDIEIDPVTGARPSVGAEDDVPIDTIGVQNEAIRIAGNVVNAGILPAKNLSLNGIDITDPKVVLGLISKLSPESIEDGQIITDFMLNDLFSWLS